MFEIFLYLIPGFVVLETFVSRSKSTFKANWPTLFRISLSSVPFLVNTYLWSTALKLFRWEWLVCLNDNWNVYVNNDVDSKRIALMLLSSLIFRYGYLPLNELISSMDSKCIKIIINLLLLLVFAPLLFPALLLGKYFAQIPDLSDSKGVLVEYLDGYLTKKARSSMLFVEVGAKIYVGNLKSVDMFSSIEKCISLKPFVSGVRDKSGSISLNTAYTESDARIIYFPLREILNLREFNKDFLYRLIEEDKIVMSEQAKRFFNPDVKDLDLDTVENEVKSFVADLAKKENATSKKDFG